MGVRSKILNVRTTEDEYSEIKKFAAFLGVSMTDLVLGSVLEKIENWEDIQAVHEHERDKAEGEVETVSWRRALADAGSL
jgi:uncharacterized protein (DUF1778 family)